MRPPPVHAFGELDRKGYLDAESRATYVLRLCRNRDRWGSLFGLAVTMGAAFVLVSLLPLTGAWNALWFVPSIFFGCSSTCLVKAFVRPEGSLQTCSDESLELTYERLQERGRLARTLLGIGSLAAALALLGILVFDQSIFSEAGTRISDALSVALNGSTTEHRRN